MNIKNRSFLFKIGFTVLAVSGSIVLTIIQTVAQISREQARAVTVMITRPGAVGGDAGDGGSGVLVQRQGNRYRVLTNCHVLKVNGEDYEGIYTLTLDGNRYSVRVSSPQRNNCHPRGIDLAILEFESDRNYDPVPVRPETDLEVILNDPSMNLAGFNNVLYDGDSTQPRSLRFVEGRWIGPNKSSQGYELLHTATAVNGTSGGPIFDPQGQLVAIHGVTLPRPGGGDDFGAIPMHYYTRWQGTGLPTPTPARPTPTPPITRPTPVPPVVTPPSPRATFLGLPVEPFSYTTATVSANGTVRTFSRQAEVGRYVERGITLPRGAVELEMVAIRGGTFRMGSPESEESRNEEGPQHQVTVPDFYMGRYEVTQTQWFAVMGRNYNENNWQERWSSLDSRFKGDDQPIVRVSWEDAQEFIRRLNQQTGKTYRLPTEAEWEYAARAGTTTPFSYGETITPDVVNYDGNYPYGNAPRGEYRQRTIAVNELPANPWGLQHIHGNVWEWCADEWYNSYSQKPGNLRSNGSIAWTDANTNISPLIDELRVLRGGSWYNDAWSTRSADRIRGIRDIAGDIRGFRVILPAWTP